MAAEPEGEVAGPRQCERYVCDGSGAMETSYRPAGIRCNENGGTACDGEGVCDNFAVFDETTFDNGKFGP